MFHLLFNTINSQISSFTDSLVPAIRKALCDELDDVREAAATTFENLHDTIGITAIEGVLPPMLKKLGLFNWLKNTYKLCFCDFTTQFFGRLKKA